MREFSKFTQEYYVLGYLYDSYVNRPEVDSNVNKELPVKGNRFRRLQMKWELLSTKDLTVDTPNFEESPSDVLRAR